MEDCNSFSFDLKPLSANLPLVYKADYNNTMAKIPLETTELICSNLRLSVLPDLSYLTNLKILDCSNNNSTSR